MSKWRQEKDDFYDEETVIESMENDELSQEEEGFMLGYLAAI